MNKFKKILAAALIVVGANTAGCAAPDGNVSEDAETVDGSDQPNDGSTVTSC